MGLQRVGHDGATALNFTVAPQAPLSMGFSRKEYWNGLLFPFSGDLPGPGIEPVSLKSPALAGRVFTTRAPWKPSAIRHTYSRVSCVTYSCHPALEGFSTYF